MKSADTSSRGPRLPQPGKAPDLEHVPFVGNKTVADNLNESVQVSLWVKLGADARGIAIHTTDDGLVELRGKVGNERLHREVVEAVRSLEGVKSVQDHLRSPRPEASGATETQRIVFVRRFCAADEASTSAAIRQAIAQLDEHFSRSGALADRLLVIYRNLQPQTVTLDIAMPAGQLAEVASTELHAGEAPRSTGVDTLAGPGFEELLAALRALAATARDHEHPLVFWQSFDVADFRPWTGHPAAAVHLAD